MKMNNWPLLLTSEPWISHSYVIWSVVHTCLANSLNYIFTLGGWRGSRQCFWYKHKVVDICFTLIAIRYPNLEAKNTIFLGKTSLKLQIFHAIRLVSQRVALLYKVPSIIVTLQLQGEAPKRSQLVTICHLTNWLYLPFVWLLNLPLQVSAC